jgi:Ca2+-binding EF-hand superfamily protein
VWWSPPLLHSLPSGKQDDDDDQQSKANAEDFLIAAANTKGHVMGDDAWEVEDVLRGEVLSNGSYIREETLRDELECLHIGESLSDKDMDRLMGLFDATNKGTIPVRPFVLTALCGRPLVFSGLPPGADKWTTIAIGQFATGGGRGAEHFEYHVGDVWSPYGSRVDVDPLSLLGVYQSPPQLFVDPVLQRALGILHEQVNAFALVHYLDVRGGDDDNDNDASSASFTTRTASSSSVSLVTVIKTIHAQSSSSGSAPPPPWLLSGGLDMPVPLLLRTFHVLGVLRRLDLLQINRLLSYVVQPTSIRMGDYLAKGTVNVIDTLELALVGDLEPYAEPSLFETFFRPETSDREHLDQLRQAVWRVFKRRTLLKQHAHRKRPPGGSASTTTAAGNRQGRRADQRWKRQLRFEVFLELLAYVSSFDTDEDGFLTQSQFQECLTETASVAHATSETFQARLVEVCDVNGFYHVDCVEMCKLLVPPPPPPPLPTTARERNRSVRSEAAAPAGGAGRPNHEESSRPVAFFFTPYSMLEDVASVVAAKSALWEEVLRELRRDVVGEGMAADDGHALSLALARRKVGGSTPRRRPRFRPWCVDSERAMDPWLKRMKYAVHRVAPARNQMAFVETWLMKTLALVRESHKARQAKRRLKTRGTGRRGRRDAGVSAHTDLVQQAVAEATTAAALEGDDFNFNVNSGVSVTQFCKELGDLGVGLCRRDGLDLLVALWQESSVEDDDAAAAATDIHFARFVQMILGPGTVDAQGKFVPADKRSSEGTKEEDTPPPPPPPPPLLPTLDEGTKASLQKLHDAKHKASERKTNIEGMLEMLDEKRMGYVAVVDLQHVFKMAGVLLTVEDVKNVVSYASTGGGGTTSKDVVTSDHSSIPYRDILNLMDEAQRLQAQVYQRRQDKTRHTTREDKTRQKTRHKTKDKTKDKRQGKRQARTSQKIR